MNNHEDIVPKSKDSRYESMEGENVTSYFAFEPDPDMEGGPVSFCVDVKTKSDPVMVRCSSHLSRKSRNARISCSIMSENIRNNFFPACNIFVV